MRTQKLVQKRKEDKFCVSLKLLAPQESENIKNLFEQAINLLKGFKDYAITHIPREQNSGADKLARLAIKRKNTH